MTAPSVESVVLGLRKDRIFETARRLQMQLPTSATKAALARRLAHAQGALRVVLPLLRRDELRAACRDARLSDDARARSDLIAHLLDAAGETHAGPEPRSLGTDGLPRVNDLVVVRQRQYLVESVAPSTTLQHPGIPQPATRVGLVCLDDDAQGRRLEVLWELELGARVVEPSRQGLGVDAPLDAPTTFRAYLHALRWNCVTATDPGLFQALFRAGIHILDHQITPLDRAVIAAYAWFEVDAEGQPLRDAEGKPIPMRVPAYGTADPAEQQAFDDEVIDRLFVLNAERAAEEAKAAEQAAMAGGAVKGKRALKTKTTKKKAAGDGQMELL